MRYHIVIFVLLLCGCSHTSVANDVEFEKWKQAARIRFIEKNISTHVVDRVLNAVEFSPRVIELDRKQPESRLTFVQYAERTITDKRVAKGQRLLKQNHGLLQRVQERYGVPPEIIIALWGKETDYGGYIGSMVTIDALATLAFEGRRAAFFESELIAVMRLIKQNNWQPRAIKGSWAGAVGQCQFMPSNYLNYAVDGDGDGRIDLWNSIPDIFFSMGHLLSIKGWDRTIPWGQKIDDPRRIRLAQGYRLYQPDGPKGPSYAITRNFDVLKRWNNSGYFATAVGRLADKISLSQP